jgi:hypothetical protein
MSTRFRKNVLQSLFLSVWAMITLVLLAMVVLLVREIMDHGRDPLGALALAPDTEAAPTARPAADRAAATGTRTVNLYFAGPEGRYLQAEPRSIMITESTVENCRAVLTALLKGPQSEAAPILPPSATIKALYLLPQGELVVNFSRELQTEYGRLGSAALEGLLVQGIAHTVTQPELQNTMDPNVRKVRLLIEDATPTEAFPAHIDVSEPVTPDGQWLAAMDQAR